MDGISKDDSFRPVNIGYPEESRKLIVETDGGKIKMKRLPDEIEREFKQDVFNGEKFLSAKDYVKAKSSFEKALELKPEDEMLKVKIQKLEEIIKRIDEMHNSVF